MGMKARTIKSVIGKKFNKWVESITDDSVVKLVEKNTIITGGCIASMLLGEDVNDFDIYFRNKQTAFAVANYYAETFNKLNDERFAKAIDENGRITVIHRANEVLDSRGDIDDSEDPEALSSAMEKGVESLNADGCDFIPVFITSNAITLSNKVQIVLRFYGEPDKLHENYDFVHCMNYWESKNGGELTLNPNSLETLLSKELRYVGSKYPLCSLIRTRKFINRGWKINAGQYLKMALQISELDLLNPDVLKEQLTGVDVAYFNQVIRLAKENNPEKIDSAYLIEVINRLF